MKFLLSILTLLLLPFRLLSFFFLILGIILLFALNSFISRDTYYEDAKAVFGFQKKAEKVFTKSCVNNSKCSLRIYARSYNGDVIEIFSKSIDEDKKAPVKTGFLDKIKDPFTKFFSDSDIKKTVQANNKYECMKEKNELICYSKEIVSIFKAEECFNCYDIFEKERKILEKKNYKSFLIRISHQAKNWIFRVFGVKDEEAEKVQGKLKDKIQKTVFHQFFQHDPSE